MRFVLRTALLLWIALSGSSHLPAATVTEASHSPQSPPPGQAVTVTARTAPGITNLTVEYQLVDPGRYVELRSTAYPRNWVPVAALPAAADAAGVFQFKLPAELQVHRRLVRYRFRGTDAAGKAFQFPDPTDPRPNLAYFVDGGVPGWTGVVDKANPEARLKAPVTYPTNVMRRVQSYHVIARAQAIENITWKNQTHDSEYRYTGTLVADGVVYDHTRLRARGGSWRHAMGKNMWKFDLPKGQSLVVRDDYGTREPGGWGKVNLRACIQQGDYGQRGEQGMFESVGFRLFNLAGVPAPLTHWIQLRFVTDADESPKNQYQGDYWGLYLAMEQVDDHFLKRHRLPDGKIYRMEGGGGSLSSQGKGVPPDKGELARFMRDYQQTRQGEDWWRSHLELEPYYSYRAICECIHHYDIADGKNYYYYLNPKSQKWQVIPWDIDLTWGDHMYGSGREPFYSRVLALSSLRRDYLNRLRELRDLLYNPAETGRLIDECAAVIADPAGGPSPVDADRAKWDYHPVMLSAGWKAGQGLFYQATPSRNFAGMVNLMKAYVRQRGNWIDRTLLGTTKPPATPQLAYAGQAGFPANGLRFRVNAYKGSEALAGLQWRIAEVAPPQLRDGRPIAPGKYEITPLWESALQAELTPELALRPDLVTAGRTYRVRARWKDATGTTSHWSDPVEFVAGAGN